MNLGAINKSQFFNFVIQIAGKKILNNYALIRIIFNKNLQITVVYTLKC